jgi:ribosomal protein L30E
MDDIDYRLYSCQNTMKTEIMDALRFAMLTYPAPVIINNGTIIIGNNNTINSKPDPRSEAIKWINANPPQIKESTKDYYAKYAINFADPYPTNQFGPLVKKLMNLKTVQSTGGDRKYKK